MPSAPARPASAVAYRLIRRSFNLCRLKVRRTGSLAFRIVSVISGCFAVLVPLGLPMGLGRMADAIATSVVVFCLLVYPLLQITVASHQRHHLQTKRARIYFWLLALFPLWSLPTAALLIQAIIYVGWRI